jgi:hypothetical protein
MSISRLIKYKTFQKFRRLLIDIGRVNVAIEEVK